MPGFRAGFSVWMSLGFRIQVWGLIGKRERGGFVAHVRPRLLCGHSGQFVFLCIYAELRRASSFARFAVPGNPTHRKGITDVLLFSFTGELQ